MNNKQKVLSIIAMVAAMGTGISISMIKGKHSDEKPLHKNEIVEEDDYSPKQTSKLHELLKCAEDNYKKGEYRYALFDARIVFENALKLCIEMNKCEIKDDTIVKYLVACEENELIDSALINNLHAARRMCNKNSHEIYNNSEISQGKIDYVIRQIKELLNVIDEEIENRNMEVLTNA